MVSVNGTMSYLTDLGVDLENASSLIPLEIIQAPSLGELTREGFIKGWKAVGYEICGFCFHFIATDKPQHIQSVR